MRKLILSIVSGSALLFAVTLTSCKKEECHECHYDTATGEVELGEKCGDELEELESNGFTANGTTYDVHCHEH